MTASREVGVIALVYVRFDGVGANACTSHHLSALEMASRTMTSYSALASRGSSLPHQNDADGVRPHVDRCV